MKLLNSIHILIVVAVAINCEPQIRQQFKCWRCLGFVCNYDFDETQHELIDCLNDNVCYIVQEPSDRRDFSNRKARRFCAPKNSNYLVDECKMGDFYEYVCICTTDECNRKINIPNTAPNYQYKEYFLLSSFLAFYKCEVLPTNVQTTIRSFLAEYRRIKKFDSPQSEGCKNSDSPGQESSPFGGLGGLLGGGGSGSDSGSSSSLIKKIIGGLLMSKVFGFGGSSSKQTTCKNVALGKQVGNAYFKCPSGADPPENNACCGPSNNQFCCKKNKAGLISGITIPILLALVAITVFVFENVERRKPNFDTQLRILNHNVFSIRFPPNCFHVYDN
ncbi:hypothetical protein SNEBB_000986 [Seison nebaliae]|nr:hypothetical protein SNEBB_000986 [Seison nebaliae]